MDLSLMYLNLPHLKLFLYLNLPIDVEKHRRGRKGGEGGGTIIYVVHYIFCTAIFITLDKDYF